MLRRPESYFHHKEGRKRVNLLSKKQVYVDNEVNPYKDVQSSVHIFGLLGEFGPGNVSPHLIPLHVLIYKFKNINNRKEKQETLLLDT